MDERFCAFKLNSMQYKVHLVDLLLKIKWFCCNGCFRRILFHNGQYPLILKARLDDIIQFWCDWFRLNILCIYLNLQNICLWKNRSNSKDIKIGFYVFIENASETNEILWHCTYHPVTKNIIELSSLYIILSWCNIPKIQEIQTFLFRNLFY